MADPRLNFNMTQSHLPPTGPDGKVLKPGEIEASPAPFDWKKFLADAASDSDRNNASAGQNQKESEISRIRRSILD